MKSPAFQFYPDDFIGGTSDLTPAEVGAYIRLLCCQWGKGEIPTEPDRLERIAGGAVSPNVMDKFPDRRNVRLEQERTKQAQYREAKSVSGTAGAAARWSKNGTAIVSPLANVCRTDGTAIVSPLANGMAKHGSPSPISCLLSPKDKDTIGDWAERIYQAYPLKVGKPSALRAIRKVIAVEDAERVLRRVELFATARPPGTPFTPHPATFFNARRFEDDPATWAVTANAPTRPSWDRSPAPESNAEIILRSIAKENHKPEPIRAINFDKP